MLLACRQIYNSLGTKCRLCILHLLSIGFSISTLIGYKDRNKSCWHSFGNTIPINDSPKHVEVLSDVAGNSTFKPDYLTIMFNPLIIKHILIVSVSGN